MAKDYMLIALELSKKALPHCLPNPPVGCVLVKYGQIVGQGFTQAIGGNHAEVEALNSYTGDLVGVTAYVTLEPCSFVGRTPACTARLAHSGLKHLLVAMLDPDSRNNGKGLAMLQHTGIHVELGLCEAQVSAFLSPYLSKPE
jgi:pyrimidine deaminase RibD-like protein